MASREKRKLHRYMKKRCSGALLLFRYLFFVSRDGGVGGGGGENGGRLGVGGGRGGVYFELFGQYCQCLGLWVFHNFRALRHSFE